MVIRETVQPIIDKIISQINDDNNHFPENVSDFTLGLNMSDPKIRLNVHVQIIGDKFESFIKISGSNRKWVEEKLDEGAIIYTFHVGTHADYLKYVLCMHHDSIDISDDLVHLMVKDGTIIPAPDATQIGGGWASDVTMSKYVKNEDDTTS